MSTTQELTDMREREFVLALIDAVIEGKHFAIAEVAAWFDCSWMVSPTLRVVAAAVFKLAERSEPVTAGAIAGVLQKARVDSGMSLYEIGKLIVERYGWNHIRYFAISVHEIHRRHAAAGTTAKATDRLLNNEDVDSVVDDVMKIRDVTQLPYNRGTSNKGAFTEIAESMENGASSMRAAETGVAEIDRMLEISRGNNIVIGARVGCGKSAFLAQMAVLSALNGTAAAIFSMEMTAAEIYKRCAAWSCGLQASEDRRIFLAGLARIYDLVEKRHRLHVFSGARTINEIEGEAIAYVKQNNVGLIVVDYLQLARVKGFRGSREEEISEVSRRLKLLGMNLNIPVVSASQINREGQDRPTISHLRGSGSIEQDADAIVLLHPIGAKGTVCKLEATVGKNRNGRCGVVECSWHCPVFRFYNTGSEPSFWSNN